MAGFYNEEQSGKPIDILDEGMPLAAGVTSINFTGDGVTGTNIGTDVTENIPGGGGGGTPAGNDRSIQFNDNGAFGGSDNLRLNEDGVTLEIAEGKLRSDVVKVTPPSTNLLLNPEFTNWTTVDTPAYFFTPSPITYGGIDYNFGGGQDPGCLFLNSLTLTQQGPDITGASMQSGPQTSPAISGSEDIGVVLLTVALPPEEGGTVYITTLFPNSFFADSAAVIAYFDGFIGPGNTTVEYFAHSVFTNNGVGFDYTWANPDSLVVTTGFTNPATITYSAVSTTTLNDWHSFSVNGENGQYIAQESGIVHSAPYSVRFGNNNYTTEFIEPTTPITFLPPDTHYNLSGWGFGNPGGDGGSTASMWAWALNNVQQYATQIWNPNTQVWNIYNQNGQDIYTPAYVYGTTPTGTLSDWQGVSDGSFGIDIDRDNNNNPVHYDITGVNTTGALSLDDVAAIIQTAIRTATTGGETCVYSSMGVNFTISSANTTWQSYISKLSTVGSGTDISGIVFLRMDDTYGQVIPAVNTTNYGRLDNGWNMVLNNRNSSWTTATFDIPVPASGCIQPIFGTDRSDTTSTSWLDDVSLEATGGSASAVTIWDFNDVANATSLDANDTIVKFEVDGANFFAVNGVGHLGNDFGLDVFGSNTGDQVGDGISITGTGTALDPFVSHGGGGSGDVVGPSSATDSAIALFDTTTGKLLKDSGITIASLAITNYWKPADFPLSSYITANTTYTAGDVLMNDNYIYTGTPGSSSNVLRFNSSGYNGNTGLVDKFRWEMVAQGVPDAIGSNTSSTLVFRVGDTGINNMLELNSLSGAKLYGQLQQSYTFQKDTNNGFSINTDGAYYADRTIMATHHQTGNGATDIYTGWFTADVGITGFEPNVYVAAMWGNAGDSAAHYTAFNAESFEKNGGSSTSYAFRAGSSWDYAFYSAGGKISSAFNTTASYENQVSFTTNVGHSSSYPYYFTSGLIADVTGVRGLTSRISASHAISNGQTNHAFSASVGGNAGDDHAVYNGFYFETPNKTGGTSTMNAISIDTGWDYYINATNFLVTSSGAVTASNLVYSGTSLTLYVATTGNDSNDGSSGSPFLTIQHALNVASRYQESGSVTVNIADGTYQENVVMPTALIGNLTLQGNSTTPANVVWKATTTANDCFTQVGANCVTTIRGIKFQDCTKGLNLDRTRTIIGELQFLNFTYGIWATNKSIVSEIGTTGPVFDGTGGTTPTAVNIINGSDAQFINRFTATNVRIGVFAQNSAKVTFSVGADISTTSGGYGVVIRNYSVFFHYASTPSVIAGSGTKSGIGVQITDSICSMTAGSSITVNNYGYGINIGGMSTWTEGNTCTYSFTGNTHSVYVEYSTTFLSVNAFSGETIEYYKDFSGAFPKAYGYDQRYVQLNGTSPVTTFNLTSHDADGATAVAATINTSTAWSTAGAKLESWKNNGTEKAYIGYSGTGYFAGAVGIGTAPDSTNYTLSLYNSATAGISMESGTGYCLQYFKRNGVSIGYQGLGSLSTNSYGLATYAGISAAIDIGSSSVNQMHFGHNSEGSHIWSQYDSSGYFFSIGLPVATVPTARLHVQDGRDGSTDRTAMIVDTSAAAWSNLSKLQEWRLGGVSKAFIGVNGTFCQIKPAAVTTTANVTSTTTVLTLSPNRHYMFTCKSVGKQAGNAGSIKSIIIGAFHRYSTGGAVQDGDITSQFFYSLDENDTVDLDVSGNDVIITTTTSTAMTVQHYITYEVNTI